MAAKAVARRKPGGSAQPDPEDVETIQVIRLTPADDDTRIPLFEANGETYTILARPQMEIGLQYLHLSVTEGEQLATNFLLGELLGEDGYAALRGFKGLTSKQFSQVVKIATEIALGSVESPKE